MFWWQSSAAKYAEAELRLGQGSTEVAQGEANQGVGSLYEAAMGATSLDRFRTLAARNVRQLVSDDVAAEALHSQIEPEAAMIASNMGEDICMIDQLCCFSCYRQGYIRCSFFYPRK